MARSPAGDIRYERDGTRIYIPITTMIVLSIVLSIVLTILLAIVRRLNS